MAPVKIGFVGFGTSTNCFHLPFVLPNPDLQVYAFLQRAPPSQPNARFGHCTEKFPQAKHYQSSKEFLADPELEVVVLCLANHEDLALEALAAGKHVICEKPFATSTKRADELIAAAKKSGKILTVFQNRRFDSDFRTLRHLVDKGALGDIKEAEIHFDYPNPPWIQKWKTQEYLPGTANTYELALQLFGKPASVTAFYRCNRGWQTPMEDTFTILLQYDNDLLVTVKTAVVTVMKKQLRYFVRGTEGSFLKFGNCPQEDRALADPAKPADDHFGDEDPAIWGTLTTTGKAFDEASQKLDPESGLYVGVYPSLTGYYRGYYENLVAAVRGTAKPVVDPQESRDGLRLIELARQAHLEKRTVPWSESD